MELNITEFGNDGENMYDQIPENRPVKVIKKEKVRFNSNIIADPVSNIQPNINTKSVLKKMTRPHVPEQKPKVSYDDILSKMGMFVADGQLHLLDNQPLNVQQQIKQQLQNQKQPYQQQQQQQPYQQQQQQQPYQQQKQQPYQQQKQQQAYQQPQQNSYIYNKYFNNEVNDQPDVRVPRNLQEYKNMLMHDILQKHRIKQIKSTKLVMPNSNINFAPSYSSMNMNKLFKFSNR
jgi:hypothetical protein